MSVAFGIYLGSSSCCIAVNKGGQFEVVANAAGDRVTPAVVAYHDMEMVTGLAAKQGIIRHGANTVQNVLRALSCSEDELPSPSPHAPCPKLDNGKITYQLTKGEKTCTVSAEEILTHIFNLLKGIATNQTTESELPAVISVPAWASEKALGVVRRAAGKAFTVQALVTQPVAGLLAYNLLGDNKKNLQILVLHCGGTTVVASVVEVAGGMATVRDTVTSSTVAGDKLTETLVTHFAKEFYSKYKGDPLENRRSKRKLYNASENCKHVLSTMGTAQVYVESLWEGVDFSTNLSRARFEGLASSVLAGFLQPAREVVHRTGLTEDKIQKVILSGGSAKIPRLQQMVSEAFPKAEFLCSIPPDEVLAAGASNEAALLLGKPTHTQASSLVPALATSIFCMIAGSSVNECVFSRGTPTHARLSLSLAVPSPPPAPCSVLVYEQTAPLDEPAEADVLAQVDINTLSEESKFIKADFHLKSDGSLHVTLQEPKASVSQSLVIEAERS